MQAGLALQAGRKPKGNPRLVVTNVKGGARRIYQRIDCQRGEVENRVKALKAGVEMDRASCTSFYANPFRKLLSAAAYALLQELRIIFRPGVVRAGENISVQAEELADTTIDLYWGWHQSIANSRFSERYVVGMSPKWCSFDEEGLCTAPKFFGSGRWCPQSSHRAALRFYPYENPGKCRGRQLPEFST